MHGSRILPDPLPTLAASYRTRRFAASFGEIRSCEEYVRYFPVISYRRITENPTAYFPNDLTMFLRTRGFTGSPKQIPYSEVMLEETAQPLGDWMRRWLSPGKKAFSLGSLAVEEVTTTKGTIPSFTALAKQLETTGLAILPAETPTDNASFLALSKLIVPQTEALVGPAAQVVTFLRFIVAQGEADLLQPLRHAFLTGMAEIGRLFAAEARRLVPHLQVLEFYSAAEGLFAFQSNQPVHGGNEGGLSFQGSTCFFEIETGKGIFPLADARRGETGSLIVSTQAFPRYRIGDFLLHLGEGNWQVLGKDGRTTRLGWPKDPCNPRSGPGGRQHRQFPQRQSSDRHVRSAGNGHFPGDNTQSSGSSVFPGKHSFSFEPMGPHLARLLYSRPGSIISPLNWTPKQHPAKRPSWFSSV